MMKEDLVNKLSSEIDQTLANAMVDEYTRVKRNHFLGDHEKVMTSAGRFCEAVFQVLKYIVSKRIVREPRMEEIAEELRALSKEQFQDSIRIIMPLAAKTIYSIRSKRGVAHIRGEISPGHMDCLLIVAACDWILSEFVRLYYTADQGEILKVIEGLSRREIPLVEEIDGDLIVLRNDLPVYEEILVALYKSYPKRVEYADLRRWVPYCSANSFSQALSKCRRKRLIHSNENGYLITGAGHQHVESKVMLKGIGT